MGAKKTLGRRKDAAKRKLRGLRRRWLPRAIRRRKRTDDPEKKRRRRRVVRKLKRAVRRVAKRLRKLKRAIERRALRWPRRGSFTELMYHSPGPHIHAASANRRFLVRIAKIGKVRYGLRIGEFPPFDPVEDVHVQGSWHYRDSSAPWTPRNFANRGDGLAFDANDADGGSDQERAFYAELVRRY